MQKRRANVRVLQEGRRREGEKKRQNEGKHAMKEGGGWVGDGEGRKKTRSCTLLS
jgi:hypothetical protein